MKRMPIEEAEMLLPVEQQIVLILRYKKAWPVWLIAEWIGMTHAEVTRAARRAVEAVVPLLRGETSATELLRGQAPPGDLPRELRRGTWEDSQGVKSRSPMKR